MYREHDLNDVVYHTLCALQNVSMIHFYGITTLCEVLHGDLKQKLSKAGLDMILEYGLYKDIPFDDLKGLVEWLINEHYILQTKGEYPVLHSTYEGLHYVETITNRKLRQLLLYLLKE